MSKGLYIFLILNVFYFNSNQISKSNTRSQEYYIITKKIIRHWKVPTLSFSLLLHFLHLFLTLSFSSCFSPSLFLLPLSFSSSHFFFAPSFLSSRTLPSFFSPPLLSNLPLSFILSFGSLLHLLSFFLIFLFFYDPPTIKSNNNLKESKLNVPLIIKRNINLK